MEKKAYIIFTDTGTLFTRLIKLYTGKSFNHASISFDTNLVEAYSFGRKSAGNPFIGGFVKEDTRAGLFKQAKCAVYCCTVTNDQLAKMNTYINKIEVEKDLYRYNFLGLFAVVFNKQLNRKNAFFCSQFVATVLSESDVVEFAKPLPLVTPHDLMEMAAFELRYQGGLANFRAETDVEESVKMAGII